MSEQRPSRRAFLAGGAAGALLLRTADAQDDERVEWLPLPFSEHEALAQVGGTIDAHLPDGTAVVVARVAEDRIVCVSMKCTHRECDVLYNHRRKRFGCPCHDSEFDLDGQPVAGPARRPLRSYPCELGAVVRCEEPERHQRR